MDIKKMQETQDIKKVVIEILQNKKQMTPRSKQILDKEGLSFTQRKLSIKETTV